MRQVAVSRRIEHHSWALDLPFNSEIKMQEYFPTGLCHFNSDCRRNLRYRAAAQANSGEEVKLAHGTVRAPPGEDEIGRTRQNGRTCAAIVYDPKAPRYQVLRLRVTPWPFPTPRRPNARAPPKKTQNS